MPLTASPSTASPSTSCSSKAAPALREPLVHLTHKHSLHRWPLPGLRRGWRTGRKRAKKAMFMASRGLPLDVDVFVLSLLSWNSVPQDVTLAATQAGHGTLSPRARTRAIKPAAGSNLWLGKGPAPLLQGAAPSTWALSLSPSAAPAPGEVGAAAPGEPCLLLAWSRPQGGQCQAGLCPIWGGGVPLPSSRGSLGVGR